MNKLQLERRLRRLEETVGVKSYLTESIREELEEFLNEIGDGYYDQSGEHENLDSSDMEYFLKNSSETEIKSLDKLRQKYNSAEEYSSTREKIVNRIFKLINSYYDKVKGTLSTVDKFKRIIKGKWSVDSRGFLNVAGNVFIEGRYVEHSNLLEICNAFGAKAFGKVSGDFFLKELNIKSLEGAPYEVGGEFGISNIFDLDSFQYCPKDVGSFIVYGFSLRSKTLKGLPKVVRGDFLIGGSWEVKENNWKLNDVRKICRVGGKLNLRWHYDYSDRDKDGNYLTPDKDGNYGN